MAAGCSERFPVGRRQLAGRLAAGATGAAAVLFGGGALAAPRRANTKTTIVWAPWGSVAYSSTLAELYGDAVKPFLAKNPGIHVVFSPAYGNGSQLVANVLAGQAPDLSSQWQFGPIREAGAALNLSPLIKEYGLDLSQFSPGRLAFWRTPEGLFGIPSYTNVYGTVVNLGALDEMGLRYPDREWTYEDMLRLYRAATVKGGPHKIVGGQVLNYMPNIPDTLYLYDFGGYYQDPTDQARCGLDTAGSIAAGEFWYGAITDGIANTYGNGSCFPHGLYDGVVVVDTFGTCDMPDIATKLRRFKWDFWLMPSFPKGRYTTAGPDGYVIAANTRHARETFELLHWFATDPDWQRWQMRTLLGGPVTNTLWPDYTDVLQQVAPAFRGKNLSAISEGAAGIVLDGVFAYNDDAAENILNTWGGRILAKQVSVAEGFREAAAQVNALEREASAHSAAEAALVRSLAHVAKDPRAEQLAAPSKAATGLAPDPAAKGAVTVRGGTYTVVGTGSGINDGDDGCTLLAVPWRLSRGSITCRVVAVSAAGSALQAGAKVGLMARGDLGSQAPTAALSVAVQRGVHFNSRPMPQMSEGDVQPAPGNGLPPAADILIGGTPPSGNYLRHPVWLRLVREVETWTAYTSLDGRVWTRGGNPVGVAMQGAWIGIFATPHAEPGKVRAVFDHLSFTPTASYQIGA